MSSAAEDVAAAAGVEWLGTVEPPDDPDASVSCADCGALVLLRNVPLHVSWHDALVSQPGRRRL